MLQCVAGNCVCVIVLKCVAMCCSVLQRAAVFCVAVPRSSGKSLRHTVMQCVAVCCSVLQCVAVCCSVLQCVSLCCSVLRCFALQFQGVQASH